MESCKECLYYQAAVEGRKMEQIISAMEKQDERCKYYMNVYEDNLSEILAGSGLKNDAIAIVMDYYKDNKHIWIDTEGMDQDER